MPGPSVLVIGCGALAKELLALTKTLPGFTVECLPAHLHNRPGLIPDAVRRRIDAARGTYDTIFVGYADCGTAGRLDEVLAAEGVERLPGAHCYEFFAGRERFAAMQDDDPATFYLTDYLARHFERLVIAGLGLDRHPELRDAYFGNYHRLVYLSQLDDPDLVERARAAAHRLGLAFEHVPTGYGELAPALARVPMSMVR